MSMKWPHFRRDGYQDDRTYNKAISACRAAMEEACGREELIKAVLPILASENGKSEEDYKALYMSKLENLADAIRRHLGVGGIK